MRAGVVVRRLRRACGEAAYAQRRLLEIRTGLVFTPESQRALERRELAQLEAWFDLPEHERVRART
jgi:hypothetical protein